MKNEHIFYMVVTVFLVFFGVFGFCIFPNHEALHLDSAKTENLILLYPNFKWFILIMSKWSFSLFYIVAEVWPNVVFALLFWQFVNEITTIEESKRFYFLFGLFGQTGLIFSGMFLKNLPIINNYFISYFGLRTNTSVMSIMIVLGVVLILGLIAMASFWSLNNLSSVNKIGGSAKPDKPKTKLGLSESFKMILSSRYIMLITLLLLCYGIAINLVEGPWKATAAKVYTNVAEYNSFVGNYLSYTGVLTIVFALLGSNIVRKMGWFSTAIITPIIVFVTGLIFFLITNFSPIQALLIGLFVSIDPTLIAVNVGAIQNVLSKSTKYTLFDSTKEMSYIPLNSELKTKGKAAADVIGTKLGKSVSALIQSLIFTIFPYATYNSISLYLMAVFIVVCIIWIWGVSALGKEYEDATSNMAKKEAD